MNVPVIGAPSGDASTGRVGDEGEDGVADGPDAHGGSDAVDAVDIDDGAGTVGLWPGDAGTLDLDVRRTLVQLLAGPSLDHERHRLLWPVLLREETVVRSRLADLFLELVLDPELGVAFVRQVEVETLDAPVLLRRQALTFVDSVVLLHLRQRLVRAQSAGERAVVSPAELLEDASVYAREGSTDHAGFAKRVTASIEKIKKASLLRGLRGGEERYEIAPTLKLLFSAERVAALLEEYRELGARGEAGNDASEGATIGSSPDGPLDEGPDGAPDGDGTEDRR